MTVHLEVAPTPAAIGTIFLLRVLTITMNWKITAFIPPAAEPGR